MEKGKRRLSPFAVLGIVVVFATLFMFINFYLMRGFMIFTTEEEVEESIQTEFPLFVNYL